MPFLGFFIKKIFEVCYNNGTSWYFIGGGIMAYLLRQKKRQPSRTVFYVRITYLPGGATRVLPVADETRGASGSGRQKTMPFRARMLSGTTTGSPPSIVGADELNSVFGTGSDGSAACGGYSDLSEWL